MKRNAMNRPEAEPGDMIVHPKRTVEISEVISSDYSETGWIIEGRDRTGRYFIWKQAFDGGYFHGLSHIEITSSDVYAPTHDQLYGAEEGEEQ